MNRIDQPSTELPLASAEPQVPALTKRGVLIGVGVLVFASVFAWYSIAARRTKLERTRSVFGDDFITALQLADRVRILPGRGQDFEPVVLTGTPGLGHLRKALLDERHYDWSTLSEGSVDEVDHPSALRYTLQFADPVGKRVPITKIPLELKQGWVGTVDGEQRVRVNPRVRSALEFQLKMMKNVSQQTYDDR